MGIAVASGSRRRMLGFITVLAMAVAVAFIFAPSARAHNGTVAWGCDGWTVDLENYVAGASISITVDGVLVDTESGWTEYSNSGSWDPSENHTLVVVVDAFDDSDQPVYNDPPNPFSPDFPSGEWSFTLNIAQASCTTTTTPPPSTTTTPPPSTTTTPPPSTTTTPPPSTTTTPPPSTTSTQISPSSTVGPTTTLPSTSTTAEVLPTSITAAPTTTPGSTSDTLPFTGSEPGSPALIAVVLLGAGVLALLLTRRVED